VTPRGSLWPDHLGRGAWLGGLGLAIHLFLARQAGVPLGLPLDDAWIHAAFARHLADGTGWTLLGSGGGGESSLLWPLLLAPSEWLGRGSIVWSLFLGGLSWLLLPALTGSLHPRPALRLPLTVAVATCGPLVFHALSGMETLPALTLGVWALLAFSRGRPTAAAWLAGAAAGLRPDAILLAGVLWVGEVDARREAGEGFARASRAAARTVAPAVGLWLVALLGLSLLSGSFPPSTLDGRRWALGLGPWGDFAGQGDAVQAFLWAWPSALARDLGLGAWSVSWPEPWGRGVRLAWQAVAALAMTGGAWSVVRGAGRVRERAALRLLVVWTLWILCFYCLTVPDRGHAGRYQPQVYLVAMALLASGVSLPLRRGGPARWVVPPTAALLGFGLAVSVVLGGANWAESVAHLNRVHGRAARDLPSVAGPGARVAVFDVGRVAYDAEVDLLDISALADPALAEAIQAGWLRDALHERGATHVLLPVFGPDDASPRSLRARLGLRGPGLLAIAEWESPEAEWSVSFASIGHAFRRLVLYELLPTPGDGIGRVRDRRLYSPHADR